MIGQVLLRIFAVLAKEFTQLSRDRITYAMILSLPIMQVLLFGYAINNDPHHLPAAILVQDQGNLARSVVSSLERTGYVNVVATPRTAAAMDDLIRQGRVLVAVTIPRISLRECCGTIMLRCWPRSMPLIPQPHPGSLPP